MAGANRAAQPLLVAGEGTLAAFTVDFAAAAEALHQAALPAARELARRTATDNFPGATLSARGEAALALHGTRWVAFTRSYGGAQRTRQKDVIPSLDQFTADQGAAFRVPVIARLEARQHRSARLHHLARLTLSLHLQSFRWREAFSIGWGAAEQGARTALRSQHGDYRVNRRTRAWLRFAKFAAVAGPRHAMSQGSIHGTGVLRLDLEFAPPRGCSRRRRHDDRARRHACSTNAPSRGAIAGANSRTSPYWQARLATPAAVPAP